MLLILYIPTVCALHETQCSSYHTALYISFRLHAHRTKLSASHTIYSDCMRIVRNSVFLIPYIRLHACCMKLSVRHIILRFTFHSGCPRVVRNSVFLILYIPTACASYEIQCLIPYIPTVCALHETQLKRSENRFFTYVHHARSFFRLSKHSYNRFPFNSPGSWFRK